VDKVGRSFSEQSDTGIRAGELPTYFPEESFAIGMFCNRERTAVACQFAVALRIGETHGALSPFSGADLPVVARS